MKQAFKGDIMNWYYRGALSLISVVALAMIGCGTASNNDQGVSFTMLGYSIANASTTPTSGTSIVQCSTVPNLSGGVFALGSTAETSGSSGQVLAGVVVQNNLTTQFIRTQSVALQYIIPGASIQPPSTVVPYGSVVAKAGGLFCGVVSIVPPQILAWMSLNRNSLPETPFMLIVRGQVTGTTVAGDVLTSNPTDLGFNVVTDNVIPPVSATIPAGAVSGGEETVSGTETTTTDSGSDSSGSGTQI